jgi:hypothetical protein
LPNHEARQSAWRENRRRDLPRARRFGAFVPRRGKEHDLLPFIRADIAREGRVTTDEAVQHAKLGNTFVKRR